MSRRVKINSVTVSMTAQDWELYTHKAGVQDAAARINKAFENAIAEGLSRREVEVVVLGAMRREDGYGATDSEPVGHLEDLLDEVFKR